jgi:hypothetical protein
LAIRGLEGASNFMQAVPDCASCLRVEVVADASIDQRESRLHAGEADLRLLGGGRLRICRGDPRVRFSFQQRPTDADLLHPYLAPAAALAQLWLGHEAIHGGAFATPAGAVALLGDKQAGKSTTLAWLHAKHRVTVLCDDLIVVADGSVFAGPRCLDLRAAGSLHRLLDAGARSVRGGDRLRVSLPPGPAKAPLAAIVLLRWGPRTAVQPVPLAERIRRLLPHRMYAGRIPAEPLGMLDLIAVPMVVLTRPRGEVGLRDSTTALMDYLRSPASHAC